MEDLRIGMILPGVISNITNFGVFVDIGVKQDGLIHISNLRNEFITNPLDFVSLHQHVSVKIIEIDISDAQKVEGVQVIKETDLIEALKKGEISALIAQDPARMGYLCIKTIVDHIRGKKIPLNVNVEVRVITRDNLNDPDIQKVLALPSISD